MGTLRLLGATVLLRPYVFAFLAVYLVAALPVWGWRRTSVYTALVYLLAWLAEFSAIHNGFPFGPYTYLSAPTIDRELWVAGIPFMDSLSFVFLTFAGLQTARMLREPLSRGPNGACDVRWATTHSYQGWLTWLLGGLVTMGLDLVIDPAALRGDRWFLGQVYYYPHGGLYFGVPLSNFAGWLLLACVSIAAFLVLDRRVLVKAWGPWRSAYAEALTGPALVVVVLAFNLGVTFAIGEPGLGLAGCLWALVLVLPVALKLRRLPRRSAPCVSDALHIRRMV